jgi:hypothetical protein
MIVFRQTDRRYAFVWESPSQPAGRWHGPGEGPAHYFADTPDGAWAEFLRHEEIRDPEDLATVCRTLWAVEIDAAEPALVALDRAALTGGPETWPVCQQSARELRAGGATRVQATSAALLPGAARGWRVQSGLRPGEPRDGRVIVDFTPSPSFVAWRCEDGGAPPSDLLARVRHVERKTR